MYDLVKIFVNLFIILFFVAACVLGVIIGIAMVRAQYDCIKYISELNRRNKPVEKPQIIKKQPEAPKVPRHYTWKNYLMLLLFILVYGFLIYQLFF